MPRAGYLGPSGTNSHAALAAAGDAWEPVPLPTVGEVVRSVQAGELPFGLVPVENSREGGVGATLDALVFEAPDVMMVGELVHPVTYCLVAAGALGTDEIRTVHSHPQATGQCARFLRERLPAAAVVAAASTADAVRAVASDDPLAGAPPHAAIGSRHAAELYGAVVLAEAIEDDEDNATRFAWIARREGAGAAPAGRPDSGATKTALVFWGAGDRAAGWLVACLGEFASREISLTRIESRPRRIGLGHYMFFCDLLGDASEPEVARAIEGLGSHCETVRVLGSFPAAG
jgi:prephenate dehydratase